MSSQYLTVRVGGMWYGVPLTAIIEVLHMVALAELPDAEEDVLGLLTLRNHIMPVVDLRVRFHQTQTQLSLSTPIVAVRSSTNDEMIGFAVDEVESVVTLTADTPVKVTNTPYLAGAVQLDTNMLLLLDIPAFLKRTQLSAVHEHE